MGWFDDAGGRIDQVVTVNEDSYSHWKIRLDHSSTVELTINVQDGAGVYVQTMQESEFQHFSKGTNRILTDLSANDVGRFYSGAVNLPAGEYRIVVGVQREPDHWDAFSQVAVRFEILR